MIYDVINCKEITGQPSLKGGVTGQISWKRLSDALRDSGEIGVNDCITHFETRDHFLFYTIGKK